MAYDVISYYISFQNDFKLTFSYFLKKKILMNRIFYYFKSIISGKNKIYKFDG